MRQRYWGAVPIHPLLQLSIAANGRTVMQGLMRKAELTYLWEHMVHVFSFFIQWNL